MPRNNFYPEEPDLWQAGSASGGHYGEWLCMACNDGSWRLAKNIRRHEESIKHRKAVQKKRNSQDSFQRLESLVYRHDLLLPLSDNLFVRPTGTLSSLAADKDNVDSIQYDEDPSLVDSECGNWGAGSVLRYGSDSDSELEFDHDDMNNDIMFNKDFKEWLDSGPTIQTNMSSDEEEGFELDETDSEEDIYTPDPSLLKNKQNTHFRSQYQWDTTCEWFPWSEQKLCMLDILHHIPRSPFSDKQMSLFSWVMGSLGVSSVPSQNSMKTMIESLQNYCGIRSIRYIGAFGHVYYVNDLLAIIAQEMANPKVRPHLTFFPDDAGRRITSACQALRWYTELDPDLLTPMIRRPEGDYYIFEPALLVSQTVCMPFRWYTRAGLMRGRAWRMNPEEEHNGWIVLAYEVLDISVEDLMLPFPFLSTSFSHRRIHDPRIIVGVIHEYGQSLVTWTKTDPQVGNKWRRLSQGHRVLCFPIWLYCDDTSGNSSKKWNKHNSYLFIPAGLQPPYCHLEYNVHFLSTSNLAPPLEMVEGIVEQISLGQDHGIWSWDCVLSELVLVIPSVLALLGDNPMQSKLSCHVGLLGKFFCRACLVKGSERSNESKKKSPNDPDASGASDPDASGASDNGEESDMDPSAGSDISTEDNEGEASRPASRRKAPSRKRSTETQPSTKAKAKPNGRGKHVETLGELVARARQFLSIGPLRTKSKTITDLGELYTAACKLQGKTKYKNLKSSSGVKCMYLEHFADEIFNFTRDLDGKTPEKQKKLDAFIAKKIPDSSNSISPILKLKDLDPHRDTPVEILHVVLLGFVKYLWRDAIARLKEDQKPTLITRICSFDRVGTGLSPLSGRTLVQHSGSLTGRDFRAISQIAPFVLYNLLPPYCYDAWLALSALVPLLFRPYIEDIDDYKLKVEHAIDYFLDTIARWTPRWFNKPKYHILKHLVMHIQRFGPPLLFATESFESYNALIRDLSIHSNRQAPSRDIAHGFARTNRIRHVLSGGKFLISPTSTKPAKKSNNGGSKEKPAGNNPSKILGAIDGKAQEKISVEKQSEIFYEKWKKNLLVKPDENNFKNAGVKVSELIKEDLLLQKYFGGEKHPGKQKYTDRINSKLFRPWSGTQASKHISEEIAAAAGLTRSKYFNCKACQLQNQDDCEIGYWVIAKNNETRKNFVGKVLEILQIPDSYAELQREPSMILLSIYSTELQSEFYHMPKLQETGNYALVEYANIYCTVNVQHSCATNNCTIVNARRARQEREFTKSQEPIVRHENANDLILNCAQMRDATHVQEFYRARPPLNREQVIHEGAVREISSRVAKSKNSDNQTETSETSKKSNNRPPAANSGSLRKAALSRNAINASAQRNDSPSSGHLMPSNPVARAYNYPLTYNSALTPRPYHMANASPLNPMRATALDNQAGHSGSNLLGTGRSATFGERNEALSQPQNAITSVPNLRMNYYQIPGVQVDSSAYMQYNSHHYAATGTSVTPHFR